MKRSILLAALWCGFASAAWAAEFYTPVSVTSANSNAFFPIERLHQGPGLGFDEAAPHDALAGETTWVTDAPGGYPSDYVAVAGPPVLVVDLGANTPLAEISVWGYAATNDNGVKEFQLRFATEAEGEAGFGTSIPYAPTFTAIQNNVPRQSFFFDRLVSARYVEFTCVATFFKPPGATGGDRVGLGEIAFEKFSAPPEPDLLAPAALVIPPTREPVEATVVLRNTGQLPLVISAATLSGPQAGAFSIVSKPASLVTLQSGNVVLKFTPGLLEGDVAATLTIASNDPDAPSVDIAVTSSVPPPPVEFFPISSITSSTQDSDFYPVDNLIQGIGDGFDANWPHQQGTNVAASRWVTDACGYPCDYLGSFAPPVLILDLGQNRPLQEINLWGYNKDNSNGLKEFQLRFGTDAEGTAGIGTSIAYNPTFPIEENNDSDRLAFPLEQTVNARYVEMTCTDNFYVDPGTSGGDRIGLGEIAFPSTGSVQPTVPLVITGLSRDPVTGAVALTFSSEAGKTYTIKRSSTLATWTDLAVGVPATGATTTYTDSDLPPASGVLFYRVTRP